MKNKNSDLFTLDKFIEESLYNKKIATLVTTLFSVIFLNTASLAADATVEMLNKQEKEIMVFSQKKEEFLKGYMTLSIVVIPPKIVKVIYCKIEI